jgi:hypothetical protein
MMRCRPERSPKRERKIPGTSQLNGSGEFMGETQPPSLAAVNRKGGVVEKSRHRIRVWAINNHRQAECATRFFD